MITIDRHIQYLLTQHDCVIVPGFGAFVIDYQPAHFDGDFLCPPVRTTTLNTSITHNDGLLASSIARAESITYEQAVASLSGTVSTLRHQLDVYGEIAIDGVGRIAGEGSRMEFFPSEQQIASLALRGLPKIKTVKLKQAEPAEQNADGHILPVGVRPSRLRTAMRAAAAVAAVVVVALVCSTPRIADDADAMHASMSAHVTTPRVAAAEPATQKPAPVLNIARPVSAEGCAEVDTMARSRFRAEAVRASAEVTKPASYVNPSYSTSKSADATSAGALTINPGEAYCIVVGSFNSQERADAFISQQRNASLEVLEQDGRYRVYVATCVSEAQAKALAASPSVQRRYPGAWVTRR